MLPVENDGCSNLGIAPPGVIGPGKPSLAAWTVAADKKVSMTQAEKAFFIFFRRPLLNDAPFSLLILRDFSMLPSPVTQSIGSKLNYENYTYQFVYDQQNSFLFHDSQSIQTGCRQFE
jgi:hypothetical protein